MAEPSFSKVVVAINECIAQFYTADKNDLATLGIILAKLDEILDNTNLPAEFIKDLNVIVADVENKMMSDRAEEAIQDSPSKLSQLLLHIQDAGVIKTEYNELTAEQKQFAQENITIEIDKIDEFEEILISIEKGDTSPNLWHGLKGILHTLKGDFGVLGLSSLVNLVHTVEDQIIASTAEEIPQYIKSLFALKDLLQIKISEIINGSFIDITQTELLILQGDTQVVESEHSLPEKLVVEAEESLLIEFITESKEHLIAAEAALIELETDPTNSEFINAAFRSCHTMKGVAGFINLKPVQELAHALENIMDDIREGKLELRSDVLSLLLSGFDQLGILIDKIESNLPSGECDTPEKANVAYRELIALRAAQVTKSTSITTTDSTEGESTVNKNPEVSKGVKTAAKAVQPTKPIAPVSAPIKKDKPPTSQVPKKAATHIEETVRVSVRKLDLLIDSIGEVVIAQSMLTADPDFTKYKTRSLEQKATQISMVMRQIQEEAMSLRMVTLKSTFQKMSRLVRDLSNKMNKPIDFIISGEDTELDKSIIEHIGDPLVHMLRNSIDHGIESTDERLANDKPRAGTVTLKAYHKSGNVVIDIIDDGAGLNKDVLLAKAINNGIAVADKVYSDEEIYNFIFAPGFSTAAEITDVSGRGVGMDVVKRNIVALRGSLDISSTLGKGTCFSIKLPLTMAIIDGMIVSSCNEQLILPTLSIITTVNPTEDQIQSVRGKGEMIKLHNELYRFIRLSDILLLDGERQDVTKGIAILIENINGRRIALWVDSIIKKQQVVIKSLGNLFKEYKWISGGAVLGNGKVNLILDVNAMFQLMEEKGE